MHDLANAQSYQANYAAQGARTLVVGDSLVSLTTGGTDTVEFSPGLVIEDVQVTSSGVLDFDVVNLTVWVGSQMITIQTELDATITVVPS